MGRSTVSEVPYKNGGLMHWAPKRYQEDCYSEYSRADEWRPNEPFEMTLTVGHTVSGRSAKYLIWLSPEGRQFPMFVSDLVEMLKISTIAEGSVNGWWSVRKRGQNYGVQYLGPERPAD